MVVATVSSVCDRCVTGEVEKSKSTNESLHQSISFTLLIHSSTFCSVENKRVGAVEAPATAPTTYTTVVSGLSSVHDQCGG
jgi:hypothetical protein